LLEDTKGLTEDLTEDFQHIVRNGVAKVYDAGEAGRVEYVKKIGTFLQGYRYLKKIESKDCLSDAFHQQMVGQLTEFRLQWSQLPEEFQATESMKQSFLLNVANRVYMNWQTLFLDPSQVPAAQRTPDHFSQCFDNFLFYLVSSSMTPQDVKAIRDRLVPEFLNKMGWLRWVASFQQS